jgi:hypothetical protein
MELKELINTLIGVPGAFLVMLGGASCLLGLSATTIVLAGRVLESHESTAKSLMIKGSASAGAGLFLIGVAAVGIAKREDERLDHDELQYNPVSPESKNRIVNQCLDCKYYSRNLSLPCAVHPDQPPNCPDHEKI